MSSQYSYSATTGTAIDPEVVGAVVIALYVFSLISYLIISFAMSKIFKKAGIPTWQAWVPILNTWRLLELGDQIGYLSLITVLTTIIFPFSPFTGMALFAVLYTFMLIAMYVIGKKLGKVDWFILLAIFLPVVWMYWLGFDKSKWQKLPKK